MENVNQKDGNCPSLRLVISQEGTLKKTYAPIKKYKRSESSSFMFNVEY